MNSIFKKLQWHKLTILLNSSYDQNINYTVLQAILKASYLKAFPKFKWHLEGAASIIFHVKEKRYDYKLKSDEKFIVEIILTNHSNSDVLRFIESFVRWMSIPVNSKYYSLSEIVKFETRKYNNLITEFPDMPAEGEICLDFLTPYNKKDTPSKHKTYISKEDFITAFERRFTRLFNEKINFKGNFADFHILPFYWEYTSIARHKSKTQPGTIQDLKGYTGNFYIKGKFKELLPFLLLGSELHAGNKLSFSYGYYKLHKESKKYFDKKFPNKSKITKIIKEVTRNLDTYKEITRNADNPFSADPEEITDFIFNDLKSDNYEFSPSIRIKIPKKTKGFRIIEKYKFQDLIVNKYINQVIQPIFENFFEKESIGFRKKTPRSEAINLFNKAVSTDYKYIIESDIEDFFPSIDHEILIDKLDQVIPVSDCKIKKNLIKSIKYGYFENKYFKKRLSGLSQGSPLSPILANLYLDNYDKFIKENNEKIIRYADDFIIFLKTKERAEEILEKSRIFLKAINLNLKQEKTFIKKIDEGFSFIGYNFIGMEVDENWVSAVNNIKKPLYITKPYGFLALDNDTVSILKKGKSAQSIPLMRISEIILLEKISFSTALVKRCIEMSIPIIVATNLGKYIADINPSKQKKFEISYRHKVKFDKLIPEEFIVIARELVSAKLFNYITLFKQRYSAEIKETIDFLNNQIEKVNISNNLNVIRGLEGISAKNVFKGYNCIINNENFYIEKRKRYNTDYINSLLNFGYYLLFSRINTTLRAIGLNPYLGFLHSCKDRYESLTSDLVDLFRAKIDRFIIKIINIKRIGVEDYIKAPKGYLLNSDGVRKFLNSYESELNKKNKKTNLNMSDEIYIQCHLIKSWVMNNKELKFYKWESS